MKRSGRLRRVLACTGAMAVLGTVPLLFLAEPAQAAWPATIKICNDTDSSDTNGSNTDGKNIDVDRLPGSSYGTYSNELLPGDCTGNVNDPANVRIDLTDDGANFVPNGSAMIGINNDGIDDSQGPWDMPCQDSATISNENAVPPTEALASHANTTDGVKVRVRAATVCGANLTDHVQVCSDASSNGDFDLFKIDGSDAGTELDYNNELDPGECSNFKDADGSNPLGLDLMDDAARTVTEWKWKDDSVGVWSECMRTKASEIETALIPGVMIEFTAGDPAYIGKRTVRIWPDGTSAGTACGVTGSPPAEENQATQNEADVPGLSAGGQNQADQLAEPTTEPYWAAGSDPDTDPEAGE